MKMLTRHLIAALALIALAWSPASAQVQYAPHAPTAVVFPAGVTNWTVPVGLTLVRVDGCAAGGGGGSGQTTSGSGGGGAGSGPCVADFPLVVVPGTTITVTVGAHGTGGTVGNNDATAGGNTTITGSTNHFPTLSGGSLGSPGAAGVGGTGGNGGIPLQNNGGAAATIGGCNSNTVTHAYFLPGCGGGGGGSTASTGGNGGNAFAFAGNDSNNIAGTGNASGGGGASSAFGNGGRGGGGTTPSPGAAPVNGIGGGGAGGGQNNIGGNGADGGITFKF